MDPESSTTAGSLTLVIELQPHRGVLNKLAGDGLLIRVAGKGTFVAPQKINAVSPVYKGIREQLEVLGRIVMRLRLYSRFSSFSDGMRCSGAHSPLAIFA